MQLSSELKGRQHFDAILTFQKWAEVGGILDAKRVTLFSF